MSYVEEGCWVVSGCYVPTPQTEDGLVMVEGFER